MSPTLFILILLWRIDIMSVEFSEVQIEKIIKGMDKAVVVAALLENDLGTQQDISSANAVCVIKELICTVRDMITSATEHNGNIEDIENRNV